MLADLIFTKTDFITSVLNTEILSQNHRALVWNLRSKEYVLQQLATHLLLVIRQYI